MQDADNRIVRLTNGFEAFGMVMDLLSRVEPFRHYQADRLSTAVRLQLLHRHHVAALQGRQLVGYMGWLLTRVDIAERWVAEGGALTPVPEAEANAIGVTILATPNTVVFRHLVRAGRASYPSVPVFFMRQSSAGERRTTVKSLNFSSPTPRQG